MSTISKLCPNCGSKLVFDDKDTSVVCFACDSTINVADLLSEKKGSSNGAVGFGVAMPMISGFDNPESGVVYVENFFDNFDWVDYQRNTEIDIEELEEVVHNNKLKNGAIPTAWYLDYKALAIPVRKKIEGLADLSDMIGSVYNPSDDTEALGVFDIYYNVCKALILHKADIFKRLDIAIKYATRFSLDKERLAEMQADYKSLQDLFEKDVRLVSDISEIPSYAAAEKARNDAKREELLALGIDADSVYDNAVELFNNTNPNKNQALNLFESLLGYKDSEKYISAINQYFSFNSDFYHFCGKYFIFKKESYVTTLDMKTVGKKNSQPQESTSTMLSLYEVVNGKPAETPIVKGIAQMLACYGSRIYYLKDKQGVCSYDIYSKVETTIDAGKVKDYLTIGNHAFGLIGNGKMLYIQKTPSKEAAPGCGSSSSSKTSTPSAEAPTTKNLYSLVVVDMVKNTAKTMIEKYAEIIKTNDNNVYFKWEKDVETVSTSSAGGGCGASSKPAKTKKVEVCLCNVNNGSIKSLFDESCLIEYVGKDKIVYTKLKPNNLNQDLYSYDISSGASTLIEANVYSYFDVIGDNVYYMVGNEDFCPLVRNTFDGDGREEIMRNVEKIVDKIGDWLYIQKGRRGSYNSTLVKMRADGKKSVVLCTQFKKLAKFYGNLVYYVDSENSLRCVRIDGKNNKRIAENVDFVVPTEDYLYYTRQELVSDNASALSLYKMDKEGRNVRKVIFNVNAVCNNPESKSLYFKCKEDIVFKCYAPGKEKEATFTSFVLDKFYELNKETEDFNLVLTLNYPTSKAAPASGCGSKSSTPNTIYEEIGPKTSFVKKGVEIEKNSSTAAQTTTNAQNSASGCSTTTTQTTTNTQNKASGCSTK